jgi:hypothetical protein
MTEIGEVENIAPNEGVLRNMNMVTFVFYGFLVALVIIIALRYFIVSSGVIAVTGTAAIAAGAIVA